MDDSEEGRRASVVTKAILDVVAAVPQSHEIQAIAPASRAREIRVAAARRAAAVSGTLALPPGLFGVLTILPDLAAVWRIQAQMVADIAAVYGRTPQLQQEQMLYCLFRHAAAQVVRDLVARAGKRVVFRRGTLHLLQNVAAKLGVHVSRRVIAGAAARWIPLLGAMGVAGYAYYDTNQVGATAVELFEGGDGLS